MPANLNKRLLSLDVFRGVTVAAMILVNNPGDWTHIFAPLEHAEWNGCTPTDLIFPFFLFIVGVSIVYAFDSKKNAQEKFSSLLKPILSRTLKLFALGLILSLFPFFDFSTVRIPGVLQRIALVYLACSILFIKVKPKMLFTIFLFILLSYWVLLTFVPVPGIGAANLGKETNLGAWLDRQIFTEAHLWTLSKTWDPEGLLSTLPAIGSGIMGLLVGIQLKNKLKPQIEKTRLLMLYGFIAIGLGLIFALFFPLNKSLWTSSYVLYSGGIASVFLASLYWLIDIKGYQQFTKPFVVYGVNAITVFFMSGIIARSMNLIKTTLNGESISLKVFLYKQYFTPYFSDYIASVAYALVFVLFWLIILWIMYRKNWIVKV